MVGQDVREVVVSGVRTACDEDHFSCKVWDVFCRRERHTAGRE